MGCSSCKGKKRQQRTGKSQRPTPAKPPKQKRPSPTVGQPKTKRKPGPQWQGGNPFPEQDLKEDEIDSLNLDDEFWEGKDLPVQFKDSHQLELDYEADDEFEDDDENMQWLYTPDSEECEECDESYQQMEKDLRGFKMGKIKPYILELEENKRAKIKDIEALTKRIDALKYYLNDITVDDVDISEITEPVEEDIRNMMQSFAGNTQTTAPFKD